MRRCLPVLVATLLAATGATGVSAETSAQLTSCPSAKSILAVAEFLLTEPSEVPRFWRDYEVADAAFVKLRYAELTYDAGRQFLAELAGRQHRSDRLQELRLAHATPADRATAMANNIPPSKTLETALATLGMSVFRALALDGDGDALVAQFLRLREAAPDSFTKSVQLPASVALALFDLTDDQKRLIARKAEAAGLWGLAYGLSTVQSEFDDLVALLDRMPESELGAGEESPPEKRIALLRQAVSLADIRIVPLDMAIQPLEVQKIAAARQGAGVMRSFALVVSGTRSRISPYALQPDWRNTAGDRDRACGAGGNRSKAAGSCRSS